MTSRADTLYSVLPGGGTIGGADDGGDGEAAEDAFSNHWFDDPRRGPRSCSGARSPRPSSSAATSSPSASATAGSASPSASSPFLVALYFFYQNVNRLLPAAL